MSSVKKQIEDAVITILTGGSFSQAFTPVRGPRSLKKLEQVSTLQVIVASVPTDRKRLSRKSIQWTFAIGIGLFKKIGFDAGEIDPDGIEDINNLAEEIAEALDVKLTLAEVTATPMGALVPEIDYEPDDGVFWSKGIVTVQVNASQMVTVDRV